MNYNIWETDDFYEEGVCMGSVGIKQTERTTEKHGHCVSGGKPQAR